MLLQVFHIYISAPIKPGHIVAPGIWLTQCGLLGVLPSCQNSYFALDMNGKVTVHNADHELAWEMQGGVCPDDKDDDDDAKNAEECEPGMEVKEDGTIVIGGKKVKTVLVYQKGVELSPWPFAEAPKLKIRKKY